MKKTLTPLLCLSLLAFAGNSFAQQVKGPSSSRTPYLVPSTANGKTTAILTAGDTVNGYRMAGTPDGLGAFDNGDGTFTVVMNHEFGNTAGVARAHGSTGAFVSKWIVNKSDLSVVSGSDLMQHVNLWDNATQAYVTADAATPSANARFGRFCSADLPAVSAFYHAATGLGTQERIFMNGEESGNEGRGMAHIITGAAAGYSYELPRLGKFSWENSVANPGTGDKTVVVGLDDATPGQVYIYIGNKTNSGTDIEKAGLTNGDLYGVAVSGMILETDGTYAAPNTPFTLVSLGNVQNQTGTTINSNSNIAGITQFLRPEDGAWDPRHPEDFYFATTNAFASPTRIWKLHFTDINDLTLGGTISAVLDGTEGTKMMDNIGFDHYGNLVITEDVGNNAHNGKIWSYNVDTDVLTQIFSHDTTRFINGGSQFLTQDEEASGVIDVQDILGAGWFLGADQAHYGISGEIVEGGQFFAFSNPFTECASLTTAVTVSGPTTFCTAGSVTLTAGAASSYLWSNGASSRSITVSQAGSYRVKVSGANGCFVNSDTVNITVKNIPAIKLVNAPGSSLNICEGRMATLMPPAALDLSGFSFQWNKDGNPIAGATNAVYSTGDAGAYSLTVTAGAGCSKNSDTKVVNVKPLPVAGFTAGGSTEFCKGGSVTLNADVVTGYAYTWLRDGANAGTGASKVFKTSGNYTVVANLNGCTDTSSALALVVNELPLATVSSSDPLTFCSGNSATLDANPSGAGFAYQWFNGNNILAGATDASYVTSAAGGFKVVVTDDKGCVSKPSAGVKIKVDATPSATITPLGSTTIGSGGSVKLRANSSAGFSYEWYLDGGIITGATARDYVATAGGDYTVRITRGNCSAIAAAVTVSQIVSKEQQGTTGVSNIEEGSAFELSAFPNPVTNTLTVSLQGIEQVNGTIYLMDLNGKLLISKQVNTPSVALDLRQYPAAIYLVRYKDAEGRTGTIRISKQ